MDKLGVHLEDVQCLAVNSPHCKVLFPQYYKDAVHVSVGGQVAILKWLEFAHSCFQTNVGVDVNSHMYTNIVHT